MERIVRRIWRECIGVELSTPFVRITYDEAMLRYGIDNPDLRFEMEIQEATDDTRGSEFGVFANAPAVRYIAVPKEFSRAELRRSRRRRKRGALRGSPTSSSRGRRARVADREVPRRRPARGLGVGRVDTLLFVADDERVVAKVLGRCGCSSAASSG